MKTHALRCCAGFALLTVGQVAMGADLATYLERAQTANPELEAFRLRYEAAEERVAQAGALPDPMFQVTQFVESVQTRTGPQEQVFMLNQKIPWFGTLGAKEEAASAEALGVYYAFQMRQLEVAEAVAQSFYEYAYTQRALELTEQNLQLLRDLESIVEERVRGGGDLNPLLRLKVETGRVQDRLRSLEEQRIARSARLSALLAWPVDEALPWPEWEAPVPAPLPPVDELVAALERNNPRLRMLEQRVASAEARKEVARLGGFPDLTLGVNYIRLGEPSNPMTPDAGEDPWGVTVAFNIPLWRGRVDAQRDEALALQRAAEADLRDAENQLKASLSTTVSRIRDAQRRLELYGDELLGLARQALDNTRSGYESGRTGILELIDSERSLLELELLYWRAAADTYQARIALQTLVNQETF